MFLCSTAGIKAAGRITCILFCWGLWGCGSTSTPAEAELPVLQRYQSTENYGALLVDIHGPVSTELVQFADRVRNYARERGIRVIDESQLSATDSQITLKSNDASTFRAVLYRGGKQVDEVPVRILQGDYAEFILDEMLLLWHPPGSGSSQREPVPYYVLEPTFYEVTTDSFFSLMSSDVKNMNLGNQSWYQLESRTPTFTWEAFPRDWDIPPGMRKEDFKNVRYEFRIAPARYRLIGFISHDEEAELETGLLEPQYSLRGKLAFCQKYMWSVRARFELNGVPRQTEWAGAFNIDSSLPEKPWYYRRKLPSRYIAYDNPLSYYFAVKSPKGPFMEECAYE